MEIGYSEVQSVSLVYDEQPWTDTNLPWHDSIMERAAQEKPQQCKADYVRNMHSQKDTWWVCGSAAIWLRLDIQGSHTFSVVEEEAHGQSEINIYEFKKQ